jgi:hypothetical protein
MTVHRHNVPARLVGALDAPWKTIVVESLGVPATRPRQPALRPKKTLTRAANVWARNGSV